MIYTYVIVYPSWISDQFEAFLHPNFAFLDESDTKGQRRWICGI